jgi:ATP-dependent Clp protease ATP-binding subunit ClpA
MQSHHFTEIARDVLEDAWDEASTLRHDTVRPDHLLLGLARSSDSTLRKIWSRLNIDPAEIRVAALADLPSGKPENKDSDRPYTSSSKRVIEHAMREASALGDHAVEPTHLLLGLVQLADDMVAHLLKERGVTARLVRTILADLRGRPVPEPAVLSIDVKIQLANGAWIQKTFAGADESVLSYLSENLRPS